MYSDASLDKTFHALASERRRGMLSVLARGEATAGELGAPFDISQPAVSKHLRVLEGAGLVSRKVRGRVHRLRLVLKPLMEAESWIARHREFWEESLNSLERFLDELTKKVSRK